MKIIFRKINKIMILLILINIVSFSNKGFANDLIEYESANIIPWSSWWWPWLDSKNPNLYDLNEAMEKYDYVIGIYDPNNINSAVFEEKRIHFIDANDPKNEWTGHCNAWSVASISVDEPKYGVDIGNLIFKVRHLKGLLIEAHTKYTIDSYYNVGEQKIGITVEQFLTRLRGSIKGDRRPLIMDLYYGVDSFGNYPVWNYPVYKYKIIFNETTSDNPYAKAYNCEAEIWAASDHEINPDYVGTINYSGDTYTPVKFTFYVEIDNYGRIDDEKSIWTGDSIDHHPDLIWRPDFNYRIYSDNEKIDYDKVIELTEASSYVKKLTLLQKGTEKYQAHWEWKADQQKRELIPDKNDFITNITDPLDFEIIFAKTMDTNYSGFKVELQNPTSKDWKTVTTASWSKDIFDNDKWTGSFTVLSNESWDGEVNIRVTAKGADGQELDSNPVTLDSEPNPDTLHNLTTPQDFYSIA